MATPDYASAVVEFLAQPTNIEYVFEIEERLEAVKDRLHTDERMLMATPDYASAVVEFLAQPTNIEYVLEIGERVEAVKDRLHGKFWHTVHRLLCDQITQTGSNWFINLHSEGDPALQYSKGISVELYPHPPGEARVLGVSLQQDKNGAGLTSGVCWSEAVPQGQNPRTFATRIAQVATLRTQLESSYLVDHEPWWLRRKDYDPTEVPPLREKRSCMRLAVDDSLETMIVDDVMALFHSTYALIEAANQQLAQ